MHVDLLDNEAQKIEYEKLRAIGEKKAELERLQFQLNSLERAEREQRALIDKL